jgi:hypothetical protein
MCEGSTGLAKYRQERRKVTGSNTGLGDCFHDGTKVLEIVHYWHERARNTKPDNITTRVLTMIEDDMLLEDPEARLHALQLWKRLKLSPPARQASTGMAGTPLNDWHPNLHPSAMPTGRLASPGIITRPGDISPTDPGKHNPISPYTHSYLNEQKGLIKDYKDNIATVNKVGGRRHWRIFTSLTLHSYCLLSRKPRTCWNVPSLRWPARSSMKPGS